MLTRIRLKNFKSWADTGDVALRPITGLFGTNSSGKSGLLHALLLLKQTAESGDRGLVFHFGDKFTPVDLGDFGSVLHSDGGEKDLEVSLDWTHRASVSVRDSKQANRVVAEGRRLGFSAAVSQAKTNGPTRPGVREMSHGVGQVRFGMRRKTVSKDEYELFASAPGAGDFRFVHSMGRKRPLPAPEKCYRFPDQTHAYFQNAGFLADLVLAFEERLNEVAYLGPLRTRPERRHAWTGACPSDMGRAGEAVVDAILAARERGQRISPGFRGKHLSLEEYVAKWLKELGLVHDFRIASVSEGSQLYEVRVRRASRSPEVLLTDVGFGLSRILPVLVLCLFVPDGSTVLLEQPEIHLHPSVQSGLADVMIDAWKNRKIQVIVESHSEHLLRRLQRRVAEEAVGPDDVALYFCELRARRSEVHRLNIDVFGNITNWPDNFFGDEFGEIAATMRAAQKRRETAGQ